MNNGVSKRLFLAVVCIQAVVGMSEGVADKIWYACIVAGIFLIFKLGQVILDWNNNVKKEEE
jgi:hypothetical protein